MRVGELPRVGASSRRAPALAMAVVVSAGVLAAWPFWSPGIASRYDMLFSVYRLFALEQAVRAGDYYPRLALDWAYGYGYPLFQYYAPLGSYVSLAFRLAGLGYVDATKAAFTLALLLAGSGAAALAWQVYRRSSAALLGGLLFTLSPYLLLDVYERGVLAEVFALGLLPWTLWAFHRLAERPSAPRLALAAIALAGVVLSHNITALFFAPVLALYALALVVSQRGYRALPALVGAGCLGLGLSAFFWLPALAEQGAVQTGNLLKGDLAVVGQLLDGPAVLLQTSLAFDYWGPERFRLSPVFGALALAGAIAALLSRGRKRWPLLVLAGVLVLSLACQLRPAAPVWRLPLAAFVEFPWRLLGLASLSGAVLAAGVPAALAGASGRPRGEMSGQTPWPAEVAVVALIALAGVAAATPNLSPSRSALWYQLDEREVSAEGALEREVESGLVGFTSAGEYLPAALRIPGSQIKDPAAAPGSGFSPIESLRLLALDGSRVTVEVASREPTRLLLPRLYYPGWRAIVDEGPTRVEPTEELALVGVSMPAGTHTVVAWLDETPVERTAERASVLAVVVLGVLLALSGRVGRLALAVVAVAGAAALLSGRLGPALVAASPAVVASDVELDGKVRLVGSRVEQAAGRLRVDLYWLARSRPAENYQAFVHVAGEDGKVVAQHDGAPGQGVIPSTRWYAGELVADRHEVELPDGLAPGRYRVYAGLYRLPEVRNLLPTGGRLDLAEGGRVLVQTIGLAGGR